MTKDGKPSRINDIRLFYSAENPLPSPFSAPPLPGHAEEAAFARRVAWWLNGEQFSCGSYAAPHILFTPMLKPGEIKITNEGKDWWRRDVLFGAEKDFPATKSSEFIKKAIVSVLKTIRPDLADTVDHAEKNVRTYGDDLRFLMQVRNTKHNIVEVYFSVPVEPNPVCVFTAFTKLPKGAFLEGPPQIVNAQGSPFDFNERIRITEIAKSFDDYKPRQRPVMSKLVRNRG